MIAEACEALESRMHDTTRALEEELSRAREESREVAEEARQTSARKASLLDLEVSIVLRDQVFRVLLSLSMCYV